MVLMLTPKLRRENRFDEAEKPHAVMLLLLAKGEQM